MADELESGFESKITSEPTGATSKRADSGIRKRLQTILTIKRILALIFALSLGIWAWHEVTKDVVSLSAFSSPKALDDEGLTGLYLTNRVADRIAEMESSSFTTTQHRFQPAATEDIPEVELPETKLSLKTIVQFLRTIVPDRFVRAITIDGDVMIQGATLNLIARIHRPGQVDPLVVGPVSCELPHSTKCTDQIGEQVVSELDPVVVANYWYQIDETPERSLELARRKMYSDPPSSEGLALFIGSVLIGKGELGAARSVYESALKRNPDSVGASVLLGRYYELVEDFDRARRYYKSALRMRKTQPEALNNLAYRLLEDGDLHAALDLFDEAIKRIPLILGRIEGALMFSQN